MTGSRLRRSAMVTALAVTAMLATVDAGRAVDAGPAVEAGPDVQAALSTVSFQAGTHTGYKFGPAGEVLASKTVKLTAASSAHSSGRGTVPGHGTFLSIVDGIWAGYKVRESPIAYIIGRTALTPYSPPRRITFPAGTVAGYRFDANWQLSGAKVSTLARDSGASAGQRAVINGVAYYQIVDGGWSGTWVPVGVAEAAKVLTCRTGPRTTGGAEVLTRVNGAGPEVALTFDMGGRLDPAISIVRYLLLTGTCATIFPTGSSSQTDIGGRVLAVIRAYPQIFEVANHTMYHCHLVLGGDGANCPATRPSDARVMKELTDAAAIITAGTGQNPVPYWRPPYGEYDARVLATATAASYTKTLMWDIDTIDWRAVTDTPAGPTTTQIIDKVVGRAVNGSIVLMHLGGWNTRAALPAMIHQLRSSRRLVPTTISDLLDLA